MDGSPEQYRSTAEGTGLPRKRYRSTAEEVPVHRGTGTDLPRNGSRSTAEIAGTTPGTESRYRKESVLESPESTGPDSETKIWGKPGGFEPYDLARFPLGYLTDTPPAPALLENRLTFEDGLQRLVIEGPARLGIMRPEDVEVYVVLLQLLEGRDPHQPLLFWIAEALKALGWEDTGARRSRFREAVRRMRWQAFTSFRTLHDPATGQYREETAFSLLRNYRLFSRDSGEAPRPSMVHFSEEVAALLRAGFISRLDVATFLELSSPTAQSAHRYLSAVWLRRDQPFEQHLTTYAVHLGLSASARSAPSRIMERIRGPHRELAEKGVIGAEPSYERMTGGKHRGELKIVIPPGPELVRPAPRPSPPPVARVPPPAAARAPVRDARPLDDVLRAHRERQEREHAAFVAARQDKEKP